MSGCVPVGSAAAILTIFNAGKIADQLLCMGGLVTCLWVNIRVLLLVTQTGNTFCAVASSTALEVYINRVFLGEKGVAPSGSSNFLYRSR